MRTSLFKDSNSSSMVDTSNMYIRDWRSALRSPPPTYRLGNRTFRFNYYFGIVILGVISFITLLFYLNINTSSATDVSWLARHSMSYSKDNYNSTYPLTTPILVRGMQNYRIGIVADLDTLSKVKVGDTEIWRSHLKKGYLSYTASKDLVKISWDDGEPIVLDTSFSLKNRGMELSELVTFNGKLLSFDDRTGIVYELTNNKAIPWVILLDGDGHTTKGFKSEWATVKDKTLYVGSMGKEWTTSQGDFENENPMFIKTVLPTGEVKNIDWSFNYKVMREESLGIKWPGYMIFESGMWSEVHNKWFFLPRRCSKEKYNETRDELMGCNVLITSDDSFTKIETIKLSNPNPSHGFSSFKFVPGTDDSIILALKTEELNGKTATFITSFTIDGKILLEEEKVPTDLKYEGIDFI